MTQSGCRLQVVALRATRRGAAAVSESGGDIRTLHRRWTMDPLALGRLALWLRSAGADLIHAWGAEAVAYLAAAGSLAPDAPWVVSFDATEPIPRWLAPLLRGVERRVGRCIVSNESDAQWRRSLGVAADRIVAISPEATAAPHSEISHSEFLRRLDLPASARVVAAAGRLERGRQWAEAIWCYELVRILQPDARLVIFGEGPDRERLERLTRLTSDEEGVRLVGYRDDLSHLLPHVDVFWELGRNGKGVSSIHDAIAAGAPVIVNEASPHTAAFCSRGDAWVTPTCSRSAVARRTVDLLERGGSASRARWAARVSPGGECSEYLEAYAALIPTVKDPS